MSCKKRTYNTHENIDQITKLKKNDFSTIIYGMQFQPEINIKSVLFHGSRIMFGK